MPALVASGYANMIVSTFHDLQQLIQCDDTLLAYLQYYKSIGLFLVCLRQVIMPRSATTFDHNFYCSYR